AVFLLPQHGVFARQVTPLLTALMKDKDPQVSATAARSLAQINGDPQKAAPAFHEMLKPSNPVARRRAAAEAVLIYLTLKTQYINASDRRVGRADMITVAQNIVPVVGQGLRDADVSVRRLAALALRRAAEGLRVIIPTPTPDSRPPTADAVDEEWERIKPY